MKWVYIQLFDHHSHERAMNLDSIYSYLHPRDAKALQISKSLSSDSAFRGYVFTIESIYIFDVRSNYIVFILIRALIAQAISSLNAFLLCSHDSSC